MKQATDADNTGDYETALKYYESGVEHFLHALKCEAVCGVVCVCVYGRVHEWCGTVCVLQGCVHVWV